MIWVTAGMTNGHPSCFLSLSKSKRIRLFDCNAMGKFGSISVLTAVLTWQHSYAFSPSYTPIPVCRRSRMNTNTAFNGPSSTRKKIDLSLALQNDEDDGWGESESNTVVQERELEMLRSQIDSKTSPNPNNNEEEERDLFIPIFTFVSLTGLFGAYGYEMLRLYLNGELYLPWTQ